ncbi:uncharacterized protein LOC128339842 isoform X2 [Hemicordylus capensis]|uniref:uncharacterized protein LOC128339842 isoform X2 n=1 Tax=Hemicordylus capensis TaxID=884348 RepID=UPI0023030FA4|nr:uncharacterized protein LOC128339842 isoform X2 [Hemicordylus capensis]
MHVLMKMLVGEIAMKLLFPLLLFSFLLGEYVSNWTPKTLLTSALDVVEDEGRANTTLGESQELKPHLPWISMYIPERSCHQELREKHGEFSPPTHPNGFEGNIWCNWTVWAGSRKHIIIYIKGFKSDEGCDNNKDKIFFDGVSSLAENTVVYACWKKEIFVFATYARGVHVVFLMRHSAKPRKERFLGKYYIFKHRGTKPTKDAVSFEVSTPEPNQLITDNVPQSNKEPWVFMPDHENPSLSARHSTDKTPELNESLQAKRANAHSAALTGSVQQATRYLNQMLASLYLLPTSSDSEKSPCSLKSPGEQTAALSSSSTEEILVYLGESAVASDVLSEVPFLDLSPLIEPSSLVGRMEFPSRKPLSTNVGASVKGNLQTGSESAQPVYLGLATHSLNLAYGMVATTTVEVTTEASSQGYKKIIPMNFQASILSHNVVGRDATGFEASSLFSPEQNCTSTKIYEDHLLFHSKTSKRGTLEGQPESSMLIYNDVDMVSEWETGTASIFEDATKMLGIDPILESFVEGSNQLKLPSATTELWSILEGGLHLRPRNGYHEQSSDDIFLNLPSVMPGGSGKFNLEAQSSHLLEMATKHESFLSPSETAVVPSAATGLVLSPFQQDLILSLGTTDSVPFPAMELEPSLSHSTAATLLLAIPDIEPTPLELEHALSPSMALISWFTSIEPEQTLSLAAMLLKPTVSKHDPMASEVTVADLSLGGEELEPILSEPEYAYGETATILGAATKLEAIPSANVAIPESALTPRTTVNSLTATETMSALAQDNEITLSFGLWMANAVKTKVPLRSSCCQQAPHASEEEEMPLELEHLSPSTEAFPIGQPLLEGKYGDGFPTKPGKGHRNYLSKPFDLASEQDPSLELGFPWLLMYLPVKSCHVTLKEEAGTFSPPVLSRHTNNWCNWTIWAGPKKHILIYIEGFEGNSDCDENQDMIIFQGILSSVESKVAYVCGNHGTLIFAAQAVAAHVVFLSKAVSRNHSHKHFKGKYYIFEDYETSDLTGGGVAAEDPVLQSNNSFIFSPKSYVMHSRHILDFVKTSRKARNETNLPGASRERWDKTDNTTSSEASLSSTQASLSKAIGNVTLNVLDLKRVQAAGSSVDDENRSRHKTLPVSISKTPALGASSNEEKATTYKPTVPSAFPQLSQRFRMMTKLEVVKDSGMTTESASLGNNGHMTTIWRLAYLKGTGRTAFRKTAFPNDVAFPHVSLEKQKTPASPPQSSPEVKEELIGQSLQSNAGLPRKMMDVMEFQHVEGKDALEQMNHHSYKEDNGNRDQFVAEAAPRGGNGAEPLITEIPATPTIRRKFHLTSLGRPKVLNAPPLLRTLNGGLTGTTTLNRQVVLFSNLNITTTETAVTSRPEDSGTRCTGCSQRKGLNPTPPYFPSGWLLSKKISLGGEHKNNSYEIVSIFRSHENDTKFESQHNPGDVLFEITFSTEHKGQMPPNGSEQEKALIESIKLQVQERVKLLSNEVKEVRLKEIIRKKRKEMKRKNGPNLLFTFWLHLKPEEKNISHVIHSQLKDLRGTSVGVGELRLVSVGDVNECTSGIGLCGDESICLNGYGTYFCQCKEEYEDRSSTKLGTLCVRSPRAGIGSLYSYTEILVGTTVFFISALVVVISVLCTIVKKKCTKDNVHFQEAALSGTPASSHLRPTAFDQNNIHNLLTLDPAQLKLRAKPPEWPLQLKTSPSEMYRVSIEQSECL